MYGFLLCITVFESTCIKFFPWLVSDFCRSSGGYPTPFLFRICGYGKMVQSLVSTVVQIIILAVSNSDRSQCGIIIIVAISSSIVVLVMTIFEVVFQSGSLSTNNTSTAAYGNNSRNDNDNDGSTNQDRKIELSTIASRRISDTVNPMIKEEG